MDNNNWVWQVCRITRDPDSLDFRRDYYFEEDSWAPNYLANRYTQDECYHVLQLLHRLYDEKDQLKNGAYITYAPVKVALEYLNSNN